MVANWPNHTHVTNQPPPPPPPHPPLLAARPITNPDQLGISSPKLVTRRCCNLGHRWHHVERMVEVSWYTTIVGNDFSWIPRIAWVTSLNLLSGGTDGALDKTNTAIFVYQPKAAERYMYMQVRMSLPQSPLRIFCFGQDDHFFIVTPSLARS